MKSRSSVNAASGRSRQVPWPASATVASRPQGERNRRGDVLGIGQRRHRILVAGQHQHGALHPRQARQQIQAAHFAGGRIEQDLRVETCAQLGVCIEPPAWCCRAAGRAIRRLPRCRGRGGSRRLRRRRARPRPPSLFEHRQLAIEPHVVRRARQHHLARMRRVPRQVALGDEAAEALPQHHRPHDAQHRAQPHDVVGEGVQCPFRPPAADCCGHGRGGPRRRSVPGRPGRVKSGLNDGVVEARPAVQQDQRGLFAHHRSIGAPRPAPSMSM